MPPAPGRGRAALLLATGWRLPYRSLRCAAACFDAVHVLGTALARPLRHSRHCASFTALPEDAPGFGIAAVNALCARHGIQTILPGDGPSTAFLARHGAALAAPCFPVPDAASFALLDAKDSFVALCRRLGVPVPETRVLADRAALLALLAAGGTGALVAKPLGLSGSQGVYVIRPETPAHAIDRIDYAPIMLQSHVPGPDLSAFYLCRAGRILAEVAYAPDAGALRFIEHPGIRRHAATIIGHLRYDGVIGFDVREAADGTPCFLECNPRFWINMEKSMLAGLNFVALGLWPPTAPLAAGSVVGRRIPRPAGLLRRRPGAWRAEDHALLRHYLADLPMVLVMAWDRLAREWAMATGSTIHTRGGAVSLG